MTENYNVQVSYIKNILVNIIFHKYDIPNKLIVFYFIFL